MDLPGFRDSISKMRELLQDVDKNWTEEDEKHWQVHKKFLDDYNKMLENGKNIKKTGEYLETWEHIGEWFSMRHGYAASYFPKSDLFSIMLFGMKYNIFKVLKTYYAMKKEDKYYTELEFKKKEEGRFHITPEQNEKVDEHS